MQKIKFTKMQGLGNDFILIMPDEFEKVKDKFPQVSVELCDRRFGIGADGIFVPTLNETDADLGWLFYQSDGSTAQMCGNGMRCFARFVYDNKLVDKQKFSVKTGRTNLIHPVFHCYFLLYPVSMTINMQNMDAQAQNLCCFMDGSFLLVNLT